MKSSTYTLTALVLIAGITLAVAPQPSSAQTSESASTSLINSIVSLLDEIKQHISTVYPGISTYIQGDSQTAALSGSGSGLVAHYTFDEGSGTTAGDSAGNNDGTLRGDPQWVNGGVGSAALDFDGNGDYIETATMDGSSLTALSYSMWFKTQSSWGVLLQWAGTACRVGDIPGYANCYVDGSSSGSAYTSSRVDDGSWHHLVFVHGSSGQTLYLDGQKQGSSSETFNAPDTYIRIGRFLGGSTGYWQGLLDDIRIYNRALSATEVTGLYELGGGTVSENNSPSTFTLSVSKSGSGTITSTPSGINCGSDCEKTYDDGDSVTLAASPASGYAFSSWSGGCTGTSADCSVTLTSNTSVTASFTSTTQSEVKEDDVTLVTPRLKVSDPARNWYGGPSDEYGYDILNIALTRDVNTVDNVQVEWSTDGDNWEGSNNTYEPEINISVPAEQYNVKRYYRIRAKSGPGYGGSCGSCSTVHYSDWSNVLEIVTLYPPENLKAKAKDQNSVNLSWVYRGAKDKNGREYESLPGSGYRIERSTDPDFPSAKTTTITVSQPYDLVPNPHNADEDLVTYTDNHNFADGETYYYRVRAFTTVGEGEHSKVDSISPNKLPEPVDYAAAYVSERSFNGQSSNAVDITFSTNKTGQTGFRIDKSDTGAGGWTTLKTYGQTIPANPYEDGGLTPGETYYYRVVAFNDVGDSSYDVLRVDVPNVAPPENTQWYVDSSISSGNNDGTSWTNAWHGFASINWYAVRPGDTLYISGGANGKTYSKPLYVMSGGSMDEPVTIRVGNNVAHNGEVRFRERVVLRAPWVTIDGSKSTDFGFTALSQMSDNFNMDFQAPVDFPCIYSSSPEGTKVLWAEIHNCGTSTGKNSLGGNVAGVSFNGNSGISFEHSEVAYSHIHDIWGTGVAVSGPSDRYGFGSIHHNIIERVHNDFIIGSGGLDIYNNIGRNWISPSIGHPDAFQIWAPYTRIYNNILYDTPGQLIYIQLQKENSTGVQIFNNVMYWDDTEENSGIIFTTIGDNVTLSDVIVANNLIYDLNVSQLSLNTQPNISPISVRNMTVKNNLFYVPTNQQNTGNFVSFRDFDYTVDDVVYDHNILAGSGNLGINYMGESYSSPEEFSNAFPQYGNNTSLTPQWVDAANHDYRLADSDVAARDRGADLSSFCTTEYGWSVNDCPLTKDIRGISREAGQWDVGPYEYAGGAPANNINDEDASTNMTPSIDGDLNDDGVVNSLDWSVMRPLWNTADPTADINSDGIVNSLDFSILNRNWST